MKNLLLPTQYRPGRPPKGQVFAGSISAELPLTRPAQVAIQSAGRPATALFLPGTGILKGAIMTRILVLITAAFAASTGVATAQDVGAGENSFKKCLPCHAVGADAKNKTGPVLNGLDGRHSGSVEGYNYTEANKNSGITWSEDTFKEYIRDPRTKIPGTKMVFAGIKNEKEIGDLWAYLKQFGTDGHTK